MDMTLNSIEKLDFGDDIKKDLASIYHSHRSGVAAENLREQVELVLEKMFRVPYGYSIPMEFINSEIGKLLFGIKLSISRPDYFGVREICVLVGKKRALISREMSGDVLDGVKIGGHYYATEENVLRYLTSKGWYPMTEVEAKEKIRYFKDLREKYDNMDDLEKEFNLQYGERHYGKVK